MKKVIIFMICLFVSAMSVADSYMLKGTLYLYSSECATKELAYQTGFDIRDDLASMDGQQLENKLRAEGKDVWNVEVKSMIVKVEEYADTDNKIVFRAIVEINYNYVDIDFMDYMYDYND